MTGFTINFLDHVAIRVKDLEASVHWYQHTLGLKKYQFAEWGPFPVFMLSGQTGVAIFPAKLDDVAIPFSKNVKIDHFAFNVSPQDLERAQAYLSGIGEHFEFQDHHFFHSIYLKDPDGHTVELTALVVREEEVFGRL